MEGDRLTGGLVIRRNLGSGGFGVVYEGWDENLGRNVAIKLLHPHLARDPDLVARFLREARTTAALRHPNLIEVYAISQTNDGQPFLVMELLEGESLDETFAREGRMAPALAVDLLLPALRGLAAMHREGFVHRDFKPANVFLPRDRRGEPLPAKVLDLGIAKAVHGNSAATKGVVGTVSIMAPEQFASGPPIPQMDVYAAGVTLYALLSGEWPYPDLEPPVVMRMVIQGDRQRIDQRVPSLPPALVAVVERALALAPEQRFGDAGALADALMAWRSGGQVATPGVASTAVMGAAQALPPTGGGSYPGAPDGAYPGGPPPGSYPGAPAAYPAGPAGGYLGGMPGASYPGGMPGASHPGGPGGGSYPGGPSGGSFPGGPGGGSYPGGPGSGSYPGGPGSGSYPGSPAGGSYPGGPYPAPSHPGAPPGQPWAPNAHSPSIPGAATQGAPPGGSGSSVKMVLFTLVAFAIGAALVVGGVAIYARSGEEDETASGDSEDPDPPDEPSPVAAQDAGAAVAADTGDATGAGGAGARLSCGEGMVSIPGGTFLMGSSDGDRDERPPHPVTLSPFCLDRTEVTVAAYRECVSAGACAPAATRMNSAGYSAAEAEFASPFCNGARADRDTHPVNCVSWEEASRYCRWRRARLPTEAEWEMAARGTQGRIYPWGSTRPTARRVNAADAEFLRAARNAGVSRDALFAGSDGHAGTAPVGSYPAGASPEGVVDLAGNVFEWVADRHGSYSREAQVNPVGPRRGNRRVSRGGSYTNDDAKLFRGAERVQEAPEDRLSNVGFRCAAG